MWPACRRGRAKILRVPAHREGVQGQRYPQLDQPEHHEGRAPTKVEHQGARERDKNGRCKSAKQGQEPKRAAAPVGEPVRDDGEGNRIERQRSGKAQPACP